MPTAKPRVGFHEDPRFLKVQPAWDAAFDMLSDGNAIETMNEVIALNTDSDYAVIVAESNPLDSDPIFDLPLQADIPKKYMQGSRFRFIQGMR